MKFYVDFRGYCVVEADTWQEAENEFFRLVAEDLPLPENYYEIEGVEQKWEGSV